MEYVGVGRELMLHYTLFKYNMTQAEFDLVVFLFFDHSSIEGGTCSMTLCIPTNRIQADLELDSLPYQSAQGCPYVTMDQAVIKRLADNSDDLFTSAVAQHNNTHAHTQ